MNINRHFLPLAVALVLLLCRFSPATAQGVFPFTSGPIPMCDTSTFTANVSGIGYLVPPDGMNSGNYLESLVVNITSDHPQTLQISLTSPQGTTLLLSAFNGAGGQNYTGTQFNYWGSGDITTASAPFSGSYWPQGGNFSVFDWQNADGPWVITVVDTACANGGTGPGGNWTPGWFEGSGGAFAFGFSSGPPPMNYDHDMGTQTATLCPGGSVDIMTSFSNDPQILGMGAVLSAFDESFNPVPNPYAVTQPGTYTVAYSEFFQYESLYIHGIFIVTAGTANMLGPDQVVDQCGTTMPVALPGLFNLAGLDVAWSLNGQPITNVQASTASISGVYQLVASSVLSCPDTALVTLIMHPALTLGADQVMNICPGATADLGPLYDTAGLTTTWSFAGAPVSDPSAVGFAGMYTLVATSSEGCTDTANVTLTTAALLSLGADQSMTICSNSTLDLTSLFPAAGPTQLWTMNGTSVPDPASVNSAGTYQLAVTTADGCPDTAFVHLQFDPAPALGGDQAVAICVGESVDLGTLYNATGLSTVWTFGQAPVSDPGAVQAAGNYYLEATNGFNCSDMAVVSLTVNIPPALGPDQLFNLCPWQSVDLTTVFPVAGTNATFTLNGQPVADPAHVTEAGVYTVLAVDANGCSDEALATAVPVECICAAEFTHDARCLQEPVQFNLLADSTVLAAHWDFDGAATNTTAKDPTVRFNKPGELQVTLHATLSCGEITVERIIHITDCADSCSLYIPSAYTPNGDGVNDGWIWQGECVPKDYSMKIFDRWGGLMFSSTDPYKAWDGTANGKELPTGVYAYRVAYQLLYQDPKEEVGTITLVR